MEGEITYLKTPRPPGPEWKLREEATLVVYPFVTDFSSRDSPLLYNVAGEAMGVIIRAWSNRGLPVVGKVEGEELPPLFALNPVILGKLPEELVEVLKTGDLSKIRLALKHLLPEAFPPLIQTIGKELGIGGLHANFCNMVFFEDKKGDFRGLEGRPVIELCRALMAKLGSWRVGLFPVYNGELEQPILGTMEQGHPRIIDPNELVRRLHVFASVNRVGGVEDITGIEIPEEEWENAKVITFLKDFGEFLGKNHLVSPPVWIRDYVKNPQLAELITRLVGFTRQQEGAFACFTPIGRIGVEFGGRRWDGIMVVSRTGSEEGMTLKTEMNEHSAVPVVPYVRIESGVQKAGVARIPIKGIGPYRPSVEAEEFTVPLALLEPVEAYDTVFERRNKKRFAPPIIGIIHLHVGVVGISGKISDRVAHLGVDLNSYPPVGCGVDAMQAMSFHNMKKAVELWEDSGQQLWMVCAPVPNHGTNFFVFPQRIASGLTLVNPFGVFRVLVENGLNLSPDVPQI